ncbi:hypothetical protein [Streptomyces sp. NPDC002676]
MKPVLIADHAAEAGAGGGEVVLELVDSLSELRGLRGCPPFRRGQPQVLLGELVDAVDQVAVAKLFDLPPEMNAGMLPQPTVLGPEPLDFLSG